MVMGCVLGKRATWRREARRKPKNDERRDSESTAVKVQHDVVERDKDQKIEEVPAAVAGRRSLPVASPEFRLRIGVDSAAAERWPSWLVDVAGDVIKDWKPRRANTFEKLDKVIAVNS